METARYVNISRQADSTLWEQFQNSESVGKRYGQGRKQIKTAQKDRYLTIIARHNTKYTSWQLKSELAAAAGTVVLWQTVYRRLNEGLCDRMSWVCVSLTS